MATGQRPSLPAGELPKRRDPPGASAKPQGYECWLLWVLAVDLNQDDLDEVGG